LGFLLGRVQGGLPLSGKPFGPFFLPEAALQQGQDLGVTRVGHHKGLLFHRVGKSKRLGENSSVN
jgi:hypothetical protein